MGTAPPEKGAVLGGELGERHRVVEPGSQPILWRETLSETDLSGIVEID